MINGSIKIKSNSKIPNETPDQNGNIQKEISNNNLSNSEQNKLNISNINQELINLVSKLSNSKEELKNKCL